MIFTQLNHSDIDQLAVLWHELKDYHAGRTKDFHGYYESSNFADRKASLLSKQELFLLVVKEDEVAVGFCIASVHERYGELESLYVQTAYRGKSVGIEMAKLAINWMHAHNAKCIRLLVGQGNEGVIRFYNKLGFRQRAVQMELLS